MYDTASSIRNRIINKNYSVTKLCNYTGINLGKMINFTNGEDCLSLEEIDVLRMRLIQADNKVLDFTDSCGFGK